MLLVRRLDQSGHTIAVHPGKVGGSCAAHCPGTVHHRVCVPHQTTQVFLVIKVPFYPMDTDTCKMVPIGRGANQRTYLPMLGSQSMRQGAAYEPCCPCERYDTRHLAIFPAINGLQIPCNAQKAKSQPNRGMQSENLNEDADPRGLKPAAAEAYS